MKTYTKLSLTFLAAAVLFSLSCKKTSSVIPGNTTTNTTLNTAAISKQIALDLYHSLSNGIGTTNGGLKSGSASTLKVMDDQTPCGSTVFTPTNTTTRIGDTTRNFTAHQTFMYMCDGYFNNNYTIDAYVQKDTLTTTDSGPGFNNVYGITLFYSVKATDANYTMLAFDGYTSTSAFTSKLNGSTVTESHYIRTGYNWTGITAQRTANINPIFLSGRVDFDTHMEDIVSGVTTDNGYSGFMEFLANNMMRSTIYVPGGTSKVYLINLITGQVTPV